MLIGNSGTGKTLLLNRYVKGGLPKSTTPTIGVEFATKSVRLDNGTVIKA